MKVVIAIFVVFAGLNAGSVWAYDECGDLANAYGPYDYRTAKDKLVIVEGAHFTNDVEALRRGTTGTLAGDIDYTLRASPNHHRALIAMINLGRNLKTEQPPGAKYTISCYLNRAIRFAPDDGVAYLIYGTYLMRTGNRTEAMRQLQTALSLDPDNANVHYNLGLAYFDLQDYPKARLHAKRAYEIGFAFPGLKKMLEGVGQWETKRTVPAAAKSQSQGTKAASPK